jgi:citrate synthase
MAESAARPHTRLCYHTDKAVRIRGKDLVDDLIGRMDFVDMIYFTIVGRLPTPQQVKMLNAVLVTLMEHGLTPSAIAARLVYASSPENLQSGVSAGLLAIGTVFVGTSEGCAELIGRLLAFPAGERAAAATEIVKEHRAARRPVPGFGHPMFKPDDPRAQRLLEFAAEIGLAKDHVAALRTLSQAVDSVYGRHLTINATGAIAAVLGEIGLPAQILRGIAIISRCAGLVAHLREEQLSPTMTPIWEAAEAAVPYSEEP